MISPGFFFVFSVFSFFGLLRGKRTKNGQRWQKKSVCCSWYLRNHISFDFHLWYTCINKNISRSFFHFFQMFIFWIVGGVKGQKISQNDKTILSIVIHSAWYIKNHTLWLSFAVHKCKIIISPGIFLFFKILIFWVVRWAKGQKRPKMTKKSCPLHFISQEPSIIWPWFMVHICKRIISAGVFYIFPNFNFPGQLCL